ncbi:MAG: DUF1036 domain-containing protein [Nostocaceae cyanobacterium]|nr:DUF1036 domain-containing protein [Nostocaceae cyanobacterium]
MKFFTFRSNYFPFVLPISIVMVLLTQKASFADLRVCNRTGETVYVAIAYKMDQALDCCGQSRNSGYVCKKYCAPWVAEGWWNLSPGGCENVLDRDLRYNNVYYYFAHSEGNRSLWEGNSNFCVSRDRFKYFQEGGNCSDVEVKTEYSSFLTTLF